MTRTRWRIKQSATSFADFDLGKPFARAESQTPNSTTSPAASPSTFSESRRTCSARRLTTRSTMPASLLTRRRTSSRTSSASSKPCLQYWGHMSEAASTGGLFHFVMPLLSAPARGGAGCAASTALPNSCRLLMVMRGIRWNRWPSFLKRCWGLPGSPR
jgi:hypothetical protein